MSKAHYELLENDNDILSIKAPKNRVKGPYVVVDKDTEKHWAIVALDWDGHPALAIRWFDGSRGTPISFGHPIWLVIPDKLHQAVLDELLLEDSCKKKNIICFLENEIDGDKLYENIRNNK